MFTGHSLLGTEETVQSLSFSRSSAQKDTEMVWRLISAWLFIQLTSCMAEFQYKRICYYTNWAQYRPGFGKFTPQDVDPFLCSHIIYAYATIDSFTLKTSEWNDDSTPEMKGMYEQLNDLKTTNPYLKTLLAVGGWNTGTVKMSSMLQDKDSRETFVRTSVAFLRTRTFDGLDLHFEYPGTRGSLTADKVRFARLCKELYKAFERDSLRTGKERLLIVVSVAAEKKVINRAYDVDQIVKYVDWINLMAYDLHGGWEKKTGLNAPLKARRSEVLSDRQFNVAWAARYWIQIGCPRRKLVVGMPAFGRSFKLQTPHSHSVDSEVTGGASAAPYTRETGFYSYFEVCQGFIYGGGHMVFHKEHLVPYIYKGYEWVGYDDPFSLHLKVQWIKKHHLGGWMLWALDLDDFSGNFCKEGRYPLLKAINKALGGSVFSTIDVNKGSSLHTANGTNSLRSLAGHTFSGHPSAVPSANKSTLPGNITAGQQETRTLRRQRGNKHSKRWNH
ncbi:Acidic mammalian chitinase [Lamellibrachia satsuma]|nr:Acidic mammalian chitinase [Lamellibrachia satsuma]